MKHCSRGLCFSRESPTRRPIARKMLREDFDRDDTMQFRIKGFQYNAHATRSDDPLDVVPTQTT